MLTRGEHGNIQLPKAAGIWSSYRIKLRKEIPIVFTKTHFSSGSKRWLGILFFYQVSTISPVGHEGILLAPEHDAHISGVENGGVEVGVVSDCGGQMHGGRGLRHECSGKDENEKCSFSITQEFLHNIFITSFK